MENIIYINTDFLEKHFPTLCIPHVFKNIGEDRIRFVFEQLNLGIIERIDIISRTNYKGQQYKKVFIHFYEWFNNAEALKVRQKMLIGGSIKIVYDNP